MGGRIALEGGRDVSAFPIRRLPERANCYQLDGENWADLLGGSPGAGKVLGTASVRGRMRLDEAFGRRLENFFANNRSSPRSGQKVAESRKA